MSFAELLRQSRSKPVAAIHSFLTNYDPNDRRRIYAFVEGEPDRAFYRAHLQRYASTVSDIHIYSCEGKAGVYDVCAKVIARYPGCRRVLFFVDKDVDDIIGKPWPMDPRVFVTDSYSIENYLVTREAVSRYFSDYVKIRRVEIALPPMLDEFDRQLAVFHRVAAPVMAWIVVMRRAGNRVVLNDMNMGELCKLYDGGIARRIGCTGHSYLQRVSQTVVASNIWRDVRKTTLELLRLDPKRYVRGKFEGWWFVQFIKKAVQQFAEVAKEGGGTVTISVALNDKNFIQLLAGAVPPPPSLVSCLDFHLKTDGGAQGDPETPVTGSGMSRLLRLLRIN